ncbi:YihY/virulence factor BrkB family protein [Haladaptatus sp. DFWS20]|uniref:YihY/virulence factor BrkB family protein n=1 Tax=Haladaptatus sp. DFWS20 TaxID=3403467 RepID=UPI003EBF72EB
MSVTTTALSVIDVVRERNITFLAASFAYYAFVSIFPLALLALTVGSLIGGQEFANALVQQAQGLLSNQGARFLENAIGNSSARTSASLLSAVVLLWSALKLFRGLLLAFEEVYQHDPDAGIVEQLKKGLVTLVAVAVGIALMIAIGAVIRSAALEEIPLIDFAGTLALLLGLVLVFLPLYYVLPPVNMTLREAIPGTVFAAVGWIILQGGFQAYAGAASKAPVYGALAGVILFLTWLYFAGVLLLVGAVVNVVVAGRSAALVS